MPVLKGSLPGLRALAARLEYEARIPAPRALAPAAPIAGSGALPELDSAEIARTYGIAYVQSARCGSADEATAAAERLGYPVVVKVDGVAHKARVGGVAVGLTDAEAVRAAAARMGGRVVVAEHASGGVEVLVGAVRDPDYGPMVVVGVGGAMAEQLDLVAVTLAPTDAAGALRLVASVPALGRLLGGEVPACLVDAIVAVSRLIGEHPEVVEVDVNPLLVSPQRAVALDCLIVLGAEETLKETE